MKYSFSKSKISQLKEIMAIYASAQEYMASLGNPQWGKGFPEEHDIREGILGGILYTVNIDDEIAAVFSALTFDENYIEIDGKWLTEGNYLAIHRVAVAEKFRGTGVATYVLDVAAPQLARLRGRTSIRIDTHEKNLPMLSLLSKLEFVRCGTVTLFRDGTSRIAFEKLI